MSKHMWRVEASAEYGLHIVDANGVHVSPMEHARLISAAPDLLDALQTMVMFAESPDFDGAPSDAAVTAARAAIAKALGRQQ